MIKIMVASTACVCLMAIVIGTMVLIAMGKLDAAALGTLQGVGVGGGLVGLASIPWLVIREVLKTGAIDAD